MSLKISSYKPSTDDLLSEGMTIKASYDTGKISARKFLMTEKDNVCGEISLDQCLYSQVFGNIDISKLQLQEIQQQLPYVMRFDCLPDFLENSFIFRFMDNKINFAPSWNNYKVRHYQIFSQQNRCSSVIEEDDPTVTTNHSFQKVYKYEVRMVVYEYQETQLISLLPQKSIDISRISKEITSRLFNVSSTVKLSDDNVIIFHDFYQHPLLLQQLVSELKPKSVFIPYLHDILRLSYYSHKSLERFLVDTLKTMVGNLSNIDAVGQGIGCIALQYLNNELNIDNVVFCNPPPNFQYIYNEQKIINTRSQKQDDSVYTDSRYSGQNNLSPEQIEYVKKMTQRKRNKQSAQDEQLSQECVEKYYAIKPTGNAERITVNYQLLLNNREVLLNQIRISQSAVKTTQNIKDLEIIQHCTKDTAMFTEMNDILSRISQMTYSFFKNNKIKPTLYSSYQLQKFVSQINKGNFLSLIANCMVLSPLVQYQQYIDSKLIDQEFIDQIKKFNDLLYLDMSFIRQDSVQKVVLFGTNSPFTEKQTLDFFKEVDNKDGDFFVRSIIGSGYDLFACCPQIIANLLK